jgi:hypothetical protein
MLTIDDDMKETISEIANALQTVDLLSTRLRQNLVESTPAGCRSSKARRSERSGR